VVNRDEGLSAAPNHSIQKNSPAISAAAQQSDILLNCRARWRDAWRHTTPVQYRFFAGRALAAAGVHRPPTAAAARTPVTGRTPHRPHLG